MMQNQKRVSDHVIINIPGLGDEKYSKSSNSNHVSNDQSSDDSPPKISDISICSDKKSVSASPEIVPKTETLIRRKSLSRSVYSKPKSRFGEHYVSIDSTMFDENVLLAEERVVSSRDSPNTKQGIINDGAAVGGVDEDEEIYKKVSSRKKLKNRKVRAKVLIEWLLFICILGCLIAILNFDKLHELRFWGLHLWKWCVLVLVAFSGLLVTELLMCLVVLLIELNYLLRKKALYYVHGLKESVRVFIWLAVVLLTWVLIFEDGVKRSRKTTKILHFVTWTIASLLIGSFLWLLKTLMLKFLASSFHLNTFFGRIQESIFHQYVLLTLSGPPVMESGQMLGKANYNEILVTKKGKQGKEEEKEVIIINKLHKMKQEKVSAWTMKMLVDVISNSGLTTLSNAVDKSGYYGGNEQTGKEITSEDEAIAAAYLIYRNVAQPGCTYIDEYDFRRFMIKEEVEFVFPMIDAAETGKIGRKTLTEWVVKVYKGRKALAHALNDTKTAVKQLNKLVTVLVIAIIVIVWLLLTGIANTRVLVFLSSQLVLAVFMFGNTCKTIFEAIIFVFVMHPFDVGDRCVIDGVQMIVEEMNILSTVFLRSDNEKIFYPNSVLATKPISNFYRSPDMGDTLEFSIDFKTSLEKIGSLKEKIKKYLEKNPHHWHPKHNVLVKEIENVNKIKMALVFNHTMNFQDFQEKCRRKTDLVLEMKNIFEELNIKCELLPQEVHGMGPRMGSVEEIC